jgi:hypothetical protein
MRWALLAPFLFISQAAALPLGASRPPLITPDGEEAAAEAFLAKGVIKAERLNYVRFFTTYALPEEWEWKGVKVNLRRQAELSLPYALNSLAGINAYGFIEKPKRVPGSDTLWYIDIGDFGWNLEDIDAVFKLQPYFLSPLVDGKNPNILFRADWFIVYGTDVTKVDDRGIKVIPYYVLQYGLGKEPKDKDDFERAWRVDLKQSERDKTETGTIVDAGDSVVSRHTRRLHRVRTNFGYYWYTRDVKSHDIDPDKILSRDYLEDLFANQADAGEYISSNTRGLQTYLLTAGNNQKFKRVEFGDPTIVVDKVDPSDHRVRTGKSCMVCHHFGIIPYTNAFRELLTTGGKVFAKKEIELELKAFYLKHKRGEEVRADNDLFAAAIEECNGLTPEENLKAYLSVYEWYWNEKVGPAQAARECGQSEADLVATVSPATTGRLVLLAKGKGMPREIWDSVNVGGYVQAMLLQKRVDKMPGGAKDDTPAPPPPPRDPPVPYEAEVVEDANMVDQYGRLVVRLAKGSRVSVTRLDADGVVQVAAVDGQGRQWVGYVYKSKTKPAR